jgi:nitrogen fixation NifU-like protein
MDELRDLYQDVILDHNRHPRNRGRLEHPTHTLEGFNPLCGDRLTLYLEVADGVVRDVAFDGQGCAISTASASLMTEAVKGLTVEQAENLFTEVHAMLTGQGDAGGLGKLEVLAGVKDFPTRVKCATLAWHTLHGALHRCHDSVSTEDEKP